MRKFKKVIEKLVKVQIKKGDTVVLLSGKDKGKQGRVLVVDYTRHKVTVEGMNNAKKAVRPSQQNQKGGIVDVALPVHISNVKLICPKCSKPANVTRKVMNNKKVRVCKNEKCKEVIDKS
ncbi:MAG: 50S ribosomal protein L24 [Spirochaetes bacterium]|nr:50S ribosomal protein L24 [Spirochaetota bacterium]